jgi:hypothetical protein
MVVVTIIVQFIKYVWVGLLKKVKPSARVLSVIALVIAVAGAYFWRDPVALPDPSVDPVAFGTALLSAAGAIFAAAHFFYEFVLDKLIGSLAARFRLQFLQRLLP